MMDISSLSVSLSTANLYSDMGVAIMSKVLDTVEESGDAIAQMMEAALSGIGQNIDIRA